MPEYKTVVLKTISETEKRDDSTKGWGQWILQYFVDGKHASVKVVCGDFYHKDGERRFAAKGMRPADFDALKPHYADFLAFSKNPPPLPGEAPAADKTDDIEEVPF